MRLKYEAVLMGLGRWFWNIFWLLVWLAFLYLTIPLIISTVNFRLCVIQNPWPQRKSKLQWILFQEETLQKQSFETMSSFPISTHVAESAVIMAPLSKVWEVVSAMEFTWWSLVASTELVDGASKLTLDATLRINFKVILSSCLICRLPIPFDLEKLIVGFRTATVG